MPAPTGRRLWWGDYRASEFASVDPDRTVAVLPIAAIEQHGPHLPVATDSIIAEGMLAATADRLRPDLDIRLLPLQAVGKSNEHLYAAGTLTLPAATLIDAWTELGVSVHRAGVRKLVIVSSHGGNEEIMGIIARELRVRCDMLAVKTSWMRFGLPEGLFSETERRHGIHGGEIETSLMLHFRSDLVDMAKVRAFRSLAADTEARYSLLGPTGTHAFAWIASDLNPEGVVGDASAATAEKGRLVAEHQAEGFAKLLREVSDVPIGLGFASFRHTSESPGR
jgi:creatinine amidohydrolase